MDPHIYPKSAPAAPATPDRKPIVGTANATPQSLNAASKQKADGSPPTRSEEYRDLRQDISQTKTVDLATYAHLIFDMKFNPTDSAPSESRNVKAIEVKLDLYLAAAGNRIAHEKTLYDPLNDFLNAIYRGSKDQARIYYTQADRAIHGYRLDRKPDIGHICRRLLNLRDDQNLDDFLREHWIEYMHWLLLLSFVEVKHHNGNALGARTRKRAKETTENVEEKGSSSKKQKSSGGLAVASASKDGSRLSGSTSASPAADPVPENSGTQIFQETRRQAASYARALFSAGAIRSHAVALVIDDEHFRFVFYCRSLIVESEPGDLKNSIDKRRFISLVQRLHSFSHEQFGLIPNMKLPFLQNVKLKSKKRVRGDDGKQESQPKKSKVDGKGKGKEQAVDAESSQGSLSSSESGLFSSYQVEMSEHTSAEASAPPSALPGAPPAAAELPSLVDSTYTLVVEGVERVLRITRVIFRSDGLIGRGTSVFEVKCIKEENVSENGQRTTITPDQSWEGRPLVLKLSFPPSGRTSEGELIRAASKHAEDNDSCWALKHLPHVVACVDSPDRKGTDPTQTTLQGRLKSQFEDAYEMRSLRATVLEKLEPLSSLKSAREFAQVFYDILQIHRWLYEHPRILHRDLSMANIMYRREGDNVYGVLNDFDLSLFRTRMDEGPTSKHRTGTKPFMAYDLLDTAWDKVHRYRHDLESLFYIILILSCHYSDPTTQASSLPFKAWFDQTDDLIASQKYRFLGSPSPILPVQPYFSAFTKWLRDIRLILGMGFKSQPLNVTGLYDWDTLGGHVTYTSVMKDMGSFDGKELVLRWAGVDSGN
ncbi:hypothetical protein D9757_008134 [Collybiopsis confluens]|uniref:Protein kinase domain-containing protein n=1 Tax=Collybiopsis confluens TaxID=2823264 RepID=A0A8H5HDV6_9AGAR|nr:hypothetical protein D9757_008134 [Collybiopsis confluens]